MDSSATDHERNRGGADCGFQCHRSWRKSWKFSAGSGSRSLWRYFGELAVGWGFVHFSRSSRSSGVERQFFEPSSTHTCECSRAPGK